MDERERAMLEMQAQSLAQQMLKLLTNQTYDVICNSLSMIMAGVGHAMECDEGEDRHIVIDKIAHMAHLNAEDMKTMKPIRGN
jgi:hypothetical protein